MYIYISHVILKNTACAKNKVTYNIYVCEYIYTQLRVGGYYLDNGTDFKINIQF